MINISHHSAHPLKKTLLGFIAASALALTACPGGGGDDGGEDGGPTGGDVTKRQLAEAFAEAIDGCFNETFGAQVEPGQNFFEINADDIEASLNDDDANPNIEFDQQAANDCYAYLTGGGDVCDALFSDQDVPSECASVTVGQLTADAVCAGTNECAPDLYCNLSASTDGCGVCAARAASGESCAEAACASGLVCENDVCAEPQAGPEPAVGDSCTPDGDECGSIFFDGLWCVDGACAEASVAGEGETCSFPLGPVLCEGTFSQSASCDIDFASGATDGTCVKVPVEGEACEDSCFGSYCDAGTCVAFKAVGDACEPGQCDGDEAFCNADRVCEAYEDGEADPPQCAQ